MTLSDDLAALPDEATVPVSWIRERLEDGSPTSSAGHRKATPPAPSPKVEWTWREKLWSCPAETRLAVPDACEALGRSESWLYKRTGPEAEDRLPARKAHGQLVFTAGELRTWIRDREEIIHALPMTTTDSERRAFSVVEGRRVS